MTVKVLREIHRRNRNDERYNSHIVLAASNLWQLKLIRLNVIANFTCDTLYCHGNHSPLALFYLVRIAYLMDIYRFYVYVHNGILVLLLQLAYLLTSDDRWNYHSTFDVVFVFIDWMFDNERMEHKQTNKQTHCIQSISRKVTFASIPGPSYTSTHPKITQQSRMEKQ